MAILVKLTISKQISCAFLGPPIFFSSSVLGNLQKLNSFRPARFSQKERARLYRRKQLQKKERDRETNREGERRGRERE